jgi:replicative DNA helicase
MKGDRPMLTIQFDNICLELIFAKKERNLPLSVYQDIFYCFNFNEKVFGYDIPIIFRNEVDLIKMASATLMSGGSVSEVIISMGASEKYRQLMDRIHMVTETTLEERVLDHHLKILGQMVALMKVNSNLPKLQGYLERVRSGNVETIEDTINEYFTLIKSSFKDVIDYETKLNLGLVRSLNTPDDNFNDILTEIRKKYSRQNVIPSGIPELDREFLFGGFQPSRLYMFGGTSGVGKSILLLNFNIRAALYNYSSPSPGLDFLYENEKPQAVFLYITLENYVYESWMRLYCSLLNKTKREMLSEISGERDVASVKVKEAFQKIFSSHNSSIQIEYFQPGSISPMDIAALIQKYDQRPDLRKVKAVYIDYLDLLRPDQSRDLYRLDLGEITSGLKTISASFEIPIITATQLNREAYRREGSKEPGIETISESIQKLFIADFGGIIRKDNTASDTDKEDPSLRPVRVVLNIEKNRDGKIGKTYLYFDYPRSRFLTVEEYREEYEKITEI